MSSYYESNDPHSRSAFVPKANPSYGSYIDPWSDEVVLLPPEHSAIRPLEQFSDVDGIPDWDETDNIQQGSFSAFARSSDSTRVAHRHNHKEASGHSHLAQEDQTNNGSSVDTGGLTGEPTVKQMGLRPALTLPETTTIYEACCRMAAERAHALVLSDANVLVSGILTYKDIVTTVIASELDLVNTAVSAVMTRNPISVSCDTLAVEALLKMNKGKVNQLPVVENGKVIGIVMQVDYLAGVAVGLTVADGYDYKVAFADALEKSWKMITKDDKVAT